MLDGASSSERRLLRRLINQEIAHYARYSMKAAEPIRIPVRNVAMPEGVGTLALLLVARWTPAALRRAGRSEEHTSELHSLMRISYAVFYLIKKKHLKRNRDQKH